MRVLVCPTAFKESLSAPAVAEAIAAGVRRARPEAIISAIPVSDGGPGLLDSLVPVVGGEIRLHSVPGPLGEPVEARSLWLSPTSVVIESADACGLHLVPPGKRDPLRADTRGVGEILTRCVELGATDVTLGLGGSATVDGGTGMARHFGYRFLAADGCELPAGGGSLTRLVRIDPGGPLAPGFTLTAITDVRGPLTGPDGAARRYGPQKGARAADVETLEAGLEKLGDRLRDDLGRDVAGLPGAGASGGLGAGCAAFLGAALVAGSDWVLERVGFGDALVEADLVITGEGAWDPTSDMGKVTGEILGRARAASVRSILVCGAVAGPVPPGVEVAGGSTAWLEREDVARLVAEALG